MADNQKNSASIPAPSDKNMPYKFTGLQDPALQSPGGSMPGYKFTSNAAANRAAAAQRWQAEQNFQQTRNDAQALSDAIASGRTPSTRKKAK